MKAAFLTDPKQLEIREIDDPPLPDDGLILSVVACGVCGSDLRRWKEGPPEGVGGAIPGHEVAGVVEAVGAAVTDYAPGDRLALAPDVHCSDCYYCQRGLTNLCENLEFVGITPTYPGGFAERMAVPGRVLRRGIVHRVPEGLSLFHAALSEPCSSVLAAHKRACTGVEDTVVVMGAGPIGCLHVALAKARGARTIISEPVDVRRAMARRFGPDAVVDPFNEDLGACVRELTDGVGADIVICANPVAATQTQAVEIVRKRGRVVLFGGLPKANPMTTLDGNRIHYDEIEVVGAFSYPPTTHALALDVLDRGLIPAEEIITDTFPLDRVQEAFETAASGGALKILITTEGE